MAVAADAGENEEINRLTLLTNFLTYKTSSFIAEAVAYDEPKTALAMAYHKQMSVVFARHLLMIRTQRSGESIAEYVHSLRELARDCDFVQVITEQNRDEFTRDTFINKLASSSIQQRLLEVDMIINKISKAQMSVSKRLIGFSIIWYSTPLLVLPPL